MLLTGAYRTAENNRKQARGAVDKFFTVVSEDTLLKQPGMEKLRTQLLDEALQYYRGFLSEEQGGSLDREIGLTRYYVGKITEEVESPADALAFYHQAEQTQRKLVDVPAPNADLRADLANTLNALGRAYDKQQKKDEAIEHFKEALEIRKELADDQYATEYQRTYANTLMNIGLVLQGQNALPEATEFIQRAQNIRESEKSNQDADNRIKRDLAKGYYGLAGIRLQQENIEDATKTTEPGFKSV